MGKLGGFLEIGKSSIQHRDPSQRVHDFDEFLLSMKDEERQSQGARCMDCGVPFCQSSYGCPVDNLIPEWNDLIHQGKWKEAYVRLRKTNNFPEYTGRVCPAPCQTSCVLGINEDAVTIKDNEYAIIEKAYEMGWVEAQIPKERNKKRIAVVGSGPAGLAASDQLNQLGYSVRLYERDDRIGGLLMYGIPNMKLDKGLVEKRNAIMQEEGVQFYTNTDVGKDIEATQLVEENDAVLLSCGAGKPRDLPAPGRELQGIHFAMDFLKKNTKSLLDSKLVDGQYINAKDKKVLVIGGGDTGNDCIGTSMRHGCKALTNFELLPKPHAQRSSQDPWPLYPRVLKNDYGHVEVQTKFGKDTREFSILTKEFLTKDGQNVSGVRTVRVRWEKKDSVSPPVPIEVPNSEELWEADLVLLALGFLGPEDYLIEQLALERDTRSNVKTQGYATSREKIFSAGDMRRGQSLVVWAIHEGRKAAAELHHCLSRKG